jgi:acetyltransferase
VSALPVDVVARGLRPPGAVTIIGDSPGNGPGGLIHQRLLDIGFEGRILPVNPKYGEIRGARAFASLDDLQEAPGFVAIALGAERSVDATRRAMELGATGVLVIGGGFAEAGEPGRQLQAELRQMALEHEVPLIGPNCYGMVDVRGRFAPYFGALATPLEPGPVSLVFQSGALTHATMDPFVDRAPGYSYVVTTGNEAVLTVVDYLEFVLVDRSTRVIACYLESVRDPSGFVRVARRAAELGVRLIVLKAGRSALGTQAALAHTGAVAGEERVWDTVLRDVGVLRIHDIDELRETVALAAGVPATTYGELALISISGGASAIMADVADEVGANLATIEPTTGDRLRAVLPGLASVANPLDLTGAVVSDPGLVTRAIEAIDGDSNVGHIAFALNDPMAVDPAERALYRALASAALQAKCTKPFVLFSLVAGVQDPEIVRVAHHANVPVLQGCRATLQAFAVLQEHARSGKAVPHDPTTRHISATTRARIEQAPPGPLPRDLLTAILGELAIAVPRVERAVDGAAAESVADRIGYPVVLKIDSPDILHRSDVGGVVVGLTDRPAVRRAAEGILSEVRRRAPDGRMEGLEVHEHVSGGVEVLVGVTFEPGLPPVIAVGVGGILVELFGQVSTATAPVSRERAHDMVSSGPLARLLAGYRGEQPADVESLVDAIVAVSGLADGLSDVLGAFEINPLVVLRRGEGVRALDALGVRA